MSALLTCSAIGGTTWVAMRGWSIAKWLQTIEGILMLAIFAALIVLLLLGAWHGDLPHYRPFTSLKYPR